MVVPAVILGANFYISLGAIRSLGRRGVPVYALDYDFSRAYALSSKYVHQKVRCPNLNEDEAGLVDFLVEFGGRFTEKPVLMASHDSYALILSRYSEKLSPYYRFPNQPAGLLEDIINKNSLYRLAVKHGLQMPLTLFPGKETSSGVVPGEMRYPCLVKPAISHEFVKVFRQKCFVAQDAAALKEALEKVQKAQLEVMVQEIIPGFDDEMYVFDVYIDSEGRATHTFTAQKLRQFPINFGSSTLTHHCHRPEMVELGLKYMEKLGYRGYGEIEFKRHPASGKLYMIEINARLSSLNALFDACGVEFTYAMYRDLIGEPLPDFHLAEDRPLAFWHAYEDYFSVYRYLREKQLTFKEVVRPWLAHRKVYAVWAFDDPLPFLTFGRLVMGRLWRKLAIRAGKPFVSLWRQAKSGGV